MRIYTREKALLLMQADDLRTQIDAVVPRPGSDCRVAEAHLRGELTKVGQKLNDLAVLGVHIPCYKS